MNKLSKIIAMLPVFVFSGFIASAQKFAFVDTEYILSNLPDYTSKQKQLDEMSVQWQAEIETMYKDIDKMYSDYQAEEILLPEAARKKREAEIIEKEKKAKDLQKQRFGFEGDLFKKRQEMIKPIQDKIYTEIKKIADARSYMIIFDKSSGASMLYANEKYDLSDDVLEAMGVTTAKETKE